jgi:hypothetical protein
MICMLAFLGGRSVLEVAGAAVAFFIASLGVFFWGSGMGWRDPPQDPRNRPPR